MNTAGVKPGSRLLNVLVVLKIAALAVLILGGLWIAPSLAAPAATAPAARPPATFFAFAAALVPILFSYGGWQSANTVAEEIRVAREDAAARARRGDRARRDRLRRRQLRLPRRP